MACPIIPFVPYRVDRQHGLWISTNYGITNIDLETGTFCNYYAGNGLQGNEFSQNAACTDKEDYLIFGGINGITYFRPAEITAEVKQPEVKIADFYIHNKAVKQGNTFRQARSYRNSSAGS